MNKLLMGTAVAALALGTAFEAQAACTPTGFMRDAINLTAALINPPGVVTGEVDATGCNIGIYYSGGTGSVQYADIHGANYFGIVNNGANVSISYNQVHEIGESPLNGAQHGTGIYVATEGAGTGNILYNTVWNYQKNGITVSGPLAHDIDIKSNNVWGQGPVDFIAQNGIEVGFGATHITVDGNMVTGNAYTGTNNASSTGILIIGGPYYSAAYQINTDVTSNSSIENDIGIAMVNYDAGGNPPTTPTRNKAIQNSIWDNAVTNVSGDGSPVGYQAGIDDTGDADVIRKNMICGPGYGPANPPPAVLLPIDTTFTNSPIDKNNFCGNTKFTTQVTSNTAKAHGVGKISPATK